MRERNAAQMEVISQKKKNGEGNKHSGTKGWGPRRGRGFWVWVGLQASWGQFFPATASKSVHQNLHGSFILQPKRPSSQKEAEPAFVRPEPHYIL